MLNRIEAFQLTNQMSWNSRTNRSYFFLIFSKKHHESRLRKIVIPSNRLPLGNPLGQLNCILNENLFNIKQRNHRKSAITITIICIFTLNRIKSPKQKQIKSEWMWIVGNKISDKCWKWKQIKLKVNIDVTD